VAWNLLQAQLQRAAEAVTRYDESALQHAVGALLPGYRWQPGEAAPTAEVLPLPRGSGQGSLAS
jgi:hypothetical protein